MEKRRLTSLRSVLLQYLVRTALACLLVAVGWLLALMLWIQNGELFLPAGVQFYGVAHKPIIDVDENDRPDEKYIVIGALASGDPVLCEKLGEKISIYDHETGSIDDELIYNDFYAFLNDLYDLLGIGE
mgnify:CR=1 FL=1